MYMLQLTLKTLDSIWLCNSKSSKDLKEEVPSKEPRLNSGKTFKMQVKVSCMNTSSDVNKHQGPASFHGNNFLYNYFSTITCIFYISCQ